MIALKKYWGFEAVLFVMLGAGAGFVVLQVHNTQTNYQANAQSIQQTVKQTVTQNLQTIPAIVTQPTATPSPTPTPQLAKPTFKFTPTITTTTSQTSSDGTKKITLAVTQNQDGNQTYAISLNDGPIIFSKTLVAGDTISIPFNAWSPNNVYFFIQENNGNATQVMVFNGSGAPFANGGAYLDLTGVFNQYVTAYTFGQASGWAADNLIVILTKNADGSEGTSYWFGVPDESVTPLSTKF